MELESSPIGSSINNILGHVLTCNCARKVVLGFFVQNSPYVKKFKFFKRAALKIDFLFFFFTIPEQRNSIETLWPKKKSGNIFSSRNFC